MNKKNKKINWLKIILSIFLAITTISIFSWLFNRNNESIKDIQYFETRIVENAKSNTDENYFESIEYDDTNWKIYVTETNENKNVGSNIKPIKSKYSVNISPYLLKKYQEGVSMVPSTTKTYDELIKEASKWSEKSDTKIGTIKVSPLPQKSWWSYIIPLIPSLLGFALMIGFFVYMSKNAGAGGGMFNPGKNQAIKINSKVKFSDVAGIYEVKEEVMELVDYLKYPKKYEAAGARIPKGILLGGPPGTGKTLIAKATAGEANVPFFFISASNFVEMYVGVGAKRVRELFKDARREAPAIIFIDEIDAVGRSRGSGIGGGNDEREQTLNQLLVEMDGMTENSGLLVIAATNRTDVLDPALQRPGRFDRTITVNYPDIKEREEILRLHAKGKRIQSSINFKNIAKRTPGFSGAQLENVINEASLLSVRENTGVITPNQIDEAIDRVMSGPARKNRTITEEERTMVAYHEAGHAVVGIKTEGGNKVQKITIIPRGHAGGYNLMLPEEEKYNATKKELLATIASFMGGRVAEETIYGKDKISTGAANDIEKATKIARRMVTEFGMSSLGPIQYEENNSSPFLGRDYAKNASFSSQVGHEIDIEVRKIISEAYKQAKEIIHSNLELLELIKTSLLENETIVAEEIEYIAKNMKLPPKIENDEEYKQQEHKLDDLIEKYSKEKEI